MIFRRPRRAISGPCYLGERFEQFVLLGLGDGAEVEHEVVADDARDDGRRVMTEARVEGVGGEPPPTADSPSTRAQSRGCGPRRERRRSAKARSRTSMSARVAESIARAGTSRAASPRR